jgi:hypothetical protein
MACPEILPVRRPVVRFGKDALRTTARRPATAELLRVRRKCAPHGGLPSPSHGDALCTTVHRLLTAKMRCLWRDVGCLRQTCATPRAGSVEALMFGRVLLKPELGRKPVYDNVCNKEGRAQSFTCVQCGGRVNLDLVHCIGNEASGPDSVLGPAHGEEVRKHFGILGKSLANGWPFLKVESCPGCGCRYLIYVAVFEPRNGWDQAVLQGITELVPSNSARS